MGTVPDLPQLPQQRKGRYGGVAAQIHFSCRGKVTKSDPLRLLVHKHRFRMLQLRSHLLHHLWLQCPVCQHNTRLVSAKYVV